MTGDTQSDSDAMTVVQISTSANAASTADRSRRTFGVGETVVMYAQPRISDANVFYPALGVCSNANGEVVYCAPHQPCSDSVLVAVENVTHTITFNVIKPTAYATTIASSNEWPLASGQAGAFEVKLNVELRPKSVSFAKMQVIELPRVANDAEGYFAEPSMTHILDHGTHGAGRWMPINAHNVYVDTVSAECFFAPWGNGGSFTWPIPVAWRVGTEAGVENPLCNMDQRFELDSNGTVRIKKFNRVFERPVNGGIQFGGDN